jgi:hypothetical protein
MNENQPKPPTAEELKALVRAYFDANVPGWSSASVAALRADESGGQCERLLILPAQSDSAAAAS